MRLSEALEQIALIHSQLARGEVYRGFHPVAIGLSGVFGLSAALMQSAIIGTAAEHFVSYWLQAALIAGCIGGSSTVYRYFFREDEAGRRRTRCVVGQFLPCLVAGLVVSLALVRAGADVLAILPGVWALLFGLGVFAARPYLPAAILHVACFYLSAGAALLLIPTASMVVAGWEVGIVFGIGQLATGLILHRHRRDHDV